MEKFHLHPKDILVVDDMKLACQMAQPLGIAVAYAGWGRTEFPKITAEMKNLCDYAFSSTEELEKFLFVD